MENNRYGLNLVTSSETTDSFSLETISDKYYHTITKFIHNFESSRKSVLSNTVDTPFYPIEHLKFKTV